jgi:hypothetical protein
MIAPVCAETLTGSLGSSGLVSQNYNSTSGSSQTPGSFTILKIYDIEYTAGMESFIHFDAVGQLPSWGGGVDPSSWSGPFTANITTTQIGSGTIGYQRLYTTGGIEQPGYQYLLFDVWNVSSYSGDQTVSLFFNTTAFSASQGYVGPPPSPDSGTVVFRAFDAPFTGFYTINKDTTFLNEYVATKPSGIGISGYVTKNVGGTIYTSQAFITDANGVTLSGQSGVNDDQFNFTTSSESIKVAVYSNGAIWYISPVLFAAATPTITPTPTTTIPPGYVRNNLYIWDQNDAQISGADIDVLDVEAATWTNRTADADGWITIDTLPYHTVNIYAHYPTSNIYLPNEILGLETGYYGGHNWVLVLYPYVSTPSGYVTLYINTRNYDTKAVLTGVNLQIKNLVTGATTGESTGSTDSASTVVTNATNYQITGSKAGYLSKTVVINSGEAASKTVVLELSKATVTTAPTSTIPPGGVTPVITVDPSDPSLHGGDTSLKAQEMMNWLAMNGMMLVQLCFLVTVFALLGIKFGK